MARLKSMMKKEFVSTEWKDKVNKSEIGEKKFEKHFGNFEKSKSLELDLMDIIEICSKENVELIGLKFPLTAEYIAAMRDFNMGSDSLFVNQGVKILDYQQEFVDKEELFKDEDHLNEKGGELFSRLLILTNLDEPFGDLKYEYAKSSD